MVRFAVPRVSAAVGGAGVRAADERRTVGSPADGCVGGTRRGLPAAGARPAADAAGSAVEAAGRDGGAFSPAVEPAAGRATRGADGARTVAPTSAEAGRAARPTGAPDDAGAAPVRRGDAVLLAATVFLGSADAGPRPG